MYKIIKTAVCGTAFVLASRKGEFGKGSFWMGLFIDGTVSSHLILNETYLTKLQNNWLNDERNQKFCCYISSIPIQNNSNNNKMLIDT